MLPICPFEPQFLHMIEIFLYFDEARYILERSFNEIWEEGGVDFTKQIGYYTRVSDLFERKDAVLLGYLQSLTI